MDKFYTRKGPKVLSNTPERDLSKHNTSDLTQVVVYIYSGYMTFNMAVIYKNVVYIWIKIIKVKKNTWLGLWITPIKAQRIYKKSPC